jgi:hypothetical protein
MIWIASLCLLAIAAWLFFNALNEMRWVEAHSHDETVASDEGLLPNFTALTRSGTAVAGGLISHAQENTRVANAIAKVQEKSTSYGGKLKDAGSKLSQSTSEGGKLAGGAAALGSAVSKVQEKTSDYTEKLKAAGSELAHGDGNKLAEGKAMLGKATHNAARKSGEIGQRVVSQAKTKAQAYNEARGASDEGGVFGKMVGKVSGGLEKLEQKVDAKLARNRAMEEGSSSDDLISRVAENVGSKINDIDEKIVDSGATTSKKFEA